MSVREVLVTSPSRLHFGLLAPSHASVRKFGGVGAMIERPSLKLRIRPAAQFMASGPLADRIVQFSKIWTAAQGLAEQPLVHVGVESVPRQHAGLGVGTQLALSVAAGLHACLEQPIPSPAELALSVGRGRRSAVGSYGFSLGGLLVERGVTQGEPFAPLDCQVPLPDSWRFVLVCPKGAGLAGAEEQHAFDAIPQATCEQSEQLACELRGRLVPAAVSADFVGFSRSLYRYGRLAGMYFAASQGGPYNGPRLAQIVDLIRSFGVEGVGQSSWGPTLFALTDGDAMACRLTEKLQRHELMKGADMWTSAVSNSGAVIQVHKDEKVMAGAALVRSPVR